MQQLKFSKEKNTRGLLKMFGRSVLLRMYLCVANVLLKMRKKLSVD